MEANRDDKVKVVLVAGADGSIVGGAIRGGFGGGQVGAGLCPLPGQTLHEVELSECLVRGKSAQELREILSAYRVAPTASRLVALHGQESSATGEQAPARR
jgi:hypothetical protein